jgi:Domain of unknown function (DUF5658)
VNALYKSILLFALNWLDAQLTILWVRLNIATEGNGLMASLLNLGEGPFLFTKLTIGAFAAYVLYRCSHLPIAQRGLKLVLGIYFALMGVHAVTGFSALGWRAPEVVLAYFVHLHQSVFSLVT